MSWDFRYLIPTDDTVSVTYADVERVLSPADASRPASAPLPDNVKRILSGNEKVLEGWLDVLRVDERPQFIQMMSSVITEAEKTKTAPLQSERC